MKKVLGMAAASLLVAGALQAQPASPLDVEVLFLQDAAAAVTGSGGAAEFNGIVSNSAGTTQYIFDSISAMDGILSYTSGSAAVFATESELSGGASASAGDMAIDAAGNVYCLMYDGTANRVWQIDPAGFATAATDMVLDSTGDLGKIAVDEKNSRLMIMNSFFHANHDLQYVALTASGATPTVLATEATLQTALSAHPDYVDATTNAFNPIDIAVQSDGDVIFSQGYSSNQGALGGTLLRVTETGTADILITSNDIITGVGADPNTYGIGNMFIDVLSDDSIIVYNVFSSDDVNFPNFVAVVAADGSSVTPLTNIDEMALDSDVVAAGTALIPSGNLFYFDGTPGGVDGNDDFYFTRQGTSNGNGALKLSGIRSFLDGGSNVDNWNMY
ncbi:hypothetical protein KQI84_12280 [bacterium]|nr:hypothetical protein [bacterium]